MYETTRSSAPGSIEHATYVCRPLHKLVDPGALSYQVSVSSSPTRIGNEPEEKPTTMFE